MVLESEVTTPLCGTIYGTTVYIYQGFHPSTRLSPGLILLIPFIHIRLMPTWQARITGKPIEMLDSPSVLAAHPIYPEEGPGRGGKAPRYP